MGICLRLDKMKLLLVASLSCLVALAVAQEEEDLREEPQEAKILKTAVTRTRFTTITSTTFSSCLTVLGATTQCQGRKRRDLLKKLRSVGQALEGTQDDDSVVL